MRVTNRSRSSAWRPSAWRPSTWIVYGTYNYDPMAMFFGSGDEAREFMLECVHHPHVEEVNLDVHELRGVKCRKLVWVSDDES